MKTHSLHLEPVPKAHRRLKPAATSASCSVASCSVASCSVAAGFSLRLLEQTLTFPLIVIALSSTFASAQTVSKLDSELRADLYSRLERRYPNVDHETILDILKRIDKTPKLKCAIDSVIVYTDGIVCQVTLKSDLPYDFRLSNLGRSLSPLWKARLSDAAKHEWDLPSLKNHYLFANLEESFTVLVPKGKSTTLVHVDDLESPRPAQLKPPPDAKAAKPSEFHYSITTYGTAYTKDLKKHEHIYWMGYGKTPVQWKDMAIPKNVETKVIDK